MKHLLLILFLLPIVSLSQTWEEFEQYDDHYIYSNLYHAVNERAWATMYERETFASNIYEVYTVSPIGQMYEVAYDPSGGYVEFATNYLVGTNIIIFTNYYPAYESVYPSVPDTNRYVWSEAIGDEYPFREYTNGEYVLFKKIENYSRFAWEPSGEVFRQIDLGMRINSRTAQLVASGIFGKTGPVETVASSSYELFNTTNSYEWSGGQIEVQWDWSYYNHISSGYNPETWNCEQTGGDWSNTPPPISAVDLGAEGKIVDAIFYTEQTVPDTCAGIRLGLKQDSGSWVIRDINRWNRFPTNSLFDFVQDGIGNIITNSWTYALEFPVTNIVEGWKTNQLDSYFVTNVFTSVLSNNVASHMTNFVYSTNVFYYQTSVTHFADSVPSAFVKFASDNYSRTFETQVVDGVTNRVRVERKDIILDIQQFRSVNSIPDPTIYKIEDLKENTDVKPPINDPANVLLFYNNATTTSVYDTYSASDLPQLELIQKVARRGILTNESGFVHSSDYPYYETIITTNTIGSLGQSDTFDNPIASGYNVQYTISSNNSGIFSISDGTFDTIHSAIYSITQKTYSVSTNLNEPFPKFPLSETWVFISHAKPYLLSPAYTGGDVYIDKQWLFKRWKQLQMMTQSQALLLEQTNQFNSVESVVITNKGISSGYAGGVTTTNINVLISEPSTITVPISRSTEQYQGPNPNDELQFFDLYNTITGSIDVVKTTNLAATLYNARSPRYTQNRFDGALDNGYGYFFTLSNPEIICIEGRRDTNRYISAIVWDITIKTNGIDRFVDQNSTINQEYSVSLTQSHQRVYWDEQALDLPEQFFVDDRQFVPIKTIDCGNETLTNGNFYAGSKRGIGTIAQDVLYMPLWVWFFEHPKIK